MKDENSVSKINLKEKADNEPTVDAVKIDEELESRKRKAKIFLAVNFAIFVISLIALIAIFYFISQARDNRTNLLSVNSSQTETKAEDNKDDYLPRKIDGVKVPVGKDSNFLMALMVDNHSDARPPSGLAKAHLVFEAEVEGGITRIMGVFSTGQEIEEIGPIRSARPYFIDWARELSALYVHVGGSPDALVKIQQDKILDINEFFNEHYFWRDNDKPMPHNVYTSIERLEEYLSSKSADRNRFVPWFFKDDVSLEERTASSSVKIDYKLGMYKVEWKYDKENNTYLRYVAGDPHKEKSGDVISAKNVLIQVASAIELDDKLRLEMNNIGDGKSLICMDGKCQPGTWEKKHPSDRTRFYAEDGQEVRFNPGMTWVQVVRSGIEYSFN